MTEKPNFFYKVENTGRINNLGDEFKLAFTPDLPEAGASSNQPICSLGSRYSQKTSYRFQFSSLLPLFHKEDIKNLPFPLAAPYIYTPENASRKQIYQIYYKVTTEQEQQYFMIISQPVVLSVSGQLEQASQKRNFNGFDYQRQRLLNVQA